MLFLDSKDKFLAHNLSSLMMQKSYKVTTSEMQKFFFKIDAKTNNEKLSILIDDNHISFQLPVSFDLIFSKINEVLSKKIISILNFKYNPIMQIVYYNDKVCKLGDIHSSIMSNLVLNKEGGLNKNSLYNCIWPNDKSMQINKLDTHLTNIKTRIKKDLNLDLNIVTNSGNIKLIIN